MVGGTAHPRREQAEHVGELMAEEYALFYEMWRTKMVGAATLRAQAARLRDDEARQPDWDAIRRLLEQSYRELHILVAAQAG
jgi:hypothetical protein